MSAHLGLILDELTSFAAAVSKGVDGEVWTNNEAIEILCAIRDLRADLAIIAGDLERAKVEQMPRKFVIEGLGEVQVRKANKRSQWDNEGLTRTVVSYALDERKLDEATGEFEAGWEAVARVLSECARPSWRTTPLNARGIDPDEYCKTEEGALSIQLPSRKEDGNV